LLLSSSGCLSIPKVPICAEITPDKGYCVNTVSDEEFYIDDTHLFEGRTWWESKPFILYLPASSWAAIKSYIIKSCKKYGNCDSSVTDWPDQLENIDNLVKK